MRRAGTGGYASQLADMVLEKARAMQSSIRDAEPEHMLDGVQRYARTSPGMFLSGAAILGFALGRMTRTVAGQMSSNETTSTPATVQTPLVSTSRPPQRISTVVGEASTATVSEPFVDESRIDDSRGGLSRGA